MSTYPSLDLQTAHGPTYSFEYSARDAYGANIPGWTANDPLNATWWHHVTDGSFYALSQESSTDNILLAMLSNTSLISTFTKFQGKGSVKSPPCTTTDCINAKVCYMRSGSASIAKQNCEPGFGSVQ